MTDATPGFWRRIRSVVVAGFGCFFLLLLLGVLLMPLVGIVWGIYAAHAQDRDIRSARPVEATVVSSRVVETRGRRGGRRYSPAVVYRYEVNGRE